jgi:hypothetical protein
VGFSWGLLDPGAPPLPSPPPPSPPPSFIDRRRTLLAHDEPAVAGEYGWCYRITTAITTSYVDSNFIQAGCYTKGTLPIA